VDDIDAVDDPVLAEEVRLRLASRYRSIQRSIAYGATLPRRAAAAYVAAFLVKGRKPDARRYRIHTSSRRRR
jgi:hypothetical protein